MRFCLILRADLYRPWPILRATREVELLRSQGKDVTVVSWIKDEKSDLPPQETKDGLELRRVYLAPPESMLMRFPAFLKANKLLAAKTLESKPDALLVHDLEVLRAGVIVKRKLGVPLLYHAHEDWPAMVSERSRLEAKVFSFLEKRYCTLVDHVYVPSEGIGRKYRAWGLGVTVQYATKAAATLPQVTQQRRREMRARYGFTDADCIVGLAGSLGRAEALPSIFRAMRELPSDVKLLVVGGLEDKIRTARDLAVKEGLTDRVSFTGILDSGPYMEHVGIVDVGLALFQGNTLNVMEVAPIKLFDYMAMGVPVVASDLPAMKKIVEIDAGCGLLARTEDPHSIAAAVRRLRDEPETRLLLSKQARASFISTFSWEQQQKLLRQSHRTLR